jgi:hypothetical protein
MRALLASVSRERVRRGFTPERDSEFHFMLQKAIVRSALSRTHTKPRRTCRTTLAFHQFIRPARSLGDRNLSQSLHRIRQISKSHSSSRLVSAQLTISSRYDVEQLVVSTSLQRLEERRASVTNIAHQLIKKMVTTIAIDLAVEGASNPLNSHCYPFPCLKPEVSRRFW